MCPMSKIHDVYAYELVLTGNADYLDKNHPILPLGETVE